MLIKSLEEYPKIYRSVPTHDAAVEQILKISSLPHCDTWLCIDNNSDRVSGFAYCFRQKDVEHLSSVKCAPEFMNSDVNAALAFSVVEHYINKLGLRYVVDGERNIRHKSNYQDFLVKVVNFRYAYCKLHVIYHPMVKPLIDLLYLLRKPIDLISSLSPAIYNVSCLLKQEAIARKFRK